MVDKLKKWLETYDGFSCFTVDYTGPRPGDRGIFPAGPEEISRKADVLGNVKIRSRCRFILRFVAARPEDGTENADRLLKFESWVRRQSALGLGPGFGNVPEEERIRAEKGSLSQVRGAGTGTYSVQLTAEFTDYYEVN